MPKRVIDGRIVLLSKTEYGLMRRTIGNNLPKDLLQNRHGLHTI